MERIQSFHHILNGGVGQKKKKQWTTNAIKVYYIKTESQTGYIVEGL